MSNSINIIVPTFNRPESTESMLFSILAQSLKPERMTMVDAGSVSVDYEKFYNLFQKDGVIFEVLRCKAGLTHQRNVGIDNNNCDIVLFLDDDVVLDANYLSIISVIFNNDIDKKIGGVTGQITNQPNTISGLSKLYRRLFFMSTVLDGRMLMSGFPTAIDYQKQIFSKVQILSGCNMAYRTQVFRDNRFDENLSRYAYMEDIDFSYRISLKYDLLYIPEAKLQHNMAPQERLKDFERFRMLSHHHHYLFKKNITKNYKTLFAHTLSLIGIPIQALFLKKSIMGFKGSMKAIAEIVLHKKVFPL